MLSMFIIACDTDSTGPNFEPPVARSEFCNEMEIPEPGCIEYGGSSTQTSQDIARIRGMDLRDYITARPTLRIYLNSRNYSSVTFNVGEAGLTEVTSGGVSNNGSQPYIILPVDNLCPFSNDYGQIKVSAKSYKGSLLGSNYTKYFNVSTIYPLSPTQCGDLDDQDGVDIM